VIVRLGRAHTEVDLSRFRAMVGGMAEILDDRERARSLRRRLNDHSLDIETLVAEAATVFSFAGLHAQERWLGLELNGYTVSAETSSVHDVLGLKSGERLVVQVKTYRVQSGVLADGQMVAQPFHHFFVEPLRVLVEAQRRAQIIGRNGTPTIRLDFPPNPSKPHLPTSGEFRPDTFDRIILGLRAVLPLQLGTLAQ
jgi:hypothetical protein